MSVRIWSHLSPRAFLPPASRAATAEGTPGSLPQQLDGTSAPSPAALQGPAFSVASLQGGWASAASQPRCVLADTVAMPA